MKTFLITALLTVCFTLTGCGVSQQEYDKLKQENASLSQKNASLEQEVSSLNQQVTSITEERNEFKSKYEQVSQKRDKLTARVADLEGKLNKATQVSTPSFNSESAIRDFRELTRNAKRLVGTTLTVVGTQMSDGDRLFMLCDNNSHCIYVKSSSYDWGTVENDTIAVTGTLMIDGEGDISITNVTSIKRIQK